MSLTRRQAQSLGLDFERSEDVPSNRSGRPTLGDIINRRLDRRAVLKGALAASALGALAPTLLARDARAGAKSRFHFEEIEHGVDETHHVAPGYDADVLIRWGDPILANAPAFDPMNQSAESQKQQFGYNNDYIGYIPLADDRALLCVNHEYTSRAVMLPSAARAAAGSGQAAPLAVVAKTVVDIEMAAHGGSIVEIARDADGKWSYRRDGPLNRRITALDTELRVSGPAAGHRRLRTKEDPSGRSVIGTINNCAGGTTPWGTYLMAEENFQGYFWGAVEIDPGGTVTGRGGLPDDHPETSNYQRYGVPGAWYAWGAYYDRFNIVKEPRCANRYGWVVEVDPRAPGAMPVKRTALGRFKHEGAETIVNRDGRVVVYMGDDEWFEYVYKFVTKGRFEPADAAANRDLLDEGTLSVARFHDDGTLRWLPLVHGHGPLTAENGFNDQGDVVIEARRAADLVGATPMDRPEDVQPNPQTGRVYVALTNNVTRTQSTAVNPRSPNPFGHILEITPLDGDHAATTGTWDILVRCGNPDDPEHFAVWNAATSRNGWFATPDNCAVDSRGRLWVATDQGSYWPSTGTADGLWALETEADLRGTGRMFFRAPVGAEVCGPAFSPDDQALFLAVQHVANDGVEHLEGFGRASTFEDPATRWPDFDEGMPPRPSVVVITKKGGGVIGS